MAKRIAAWRRLFFLRGTDRDVRQELQLHLEMLIEDLEAEGFAHEDARKEALRRFGALDAAAQECLTISRRSSRHTRRVDTMAALRDDIVQAIRSLRTAPLLTVIVSLTMMLAIGATTTIYSIVRQVLLEPLPYPAADRIVSIVDGDHNTNPIAFPEYEAIRQVATATFEEVGVYSSTSLTLTGVDEPVVLSGDRVSASTGRIVGVRPLLGRAFTDQDDSPSSERVIMLSESCWRRVFSGDPSVLGRTLTLEGAPFRVIGIYPSSANTALPNEIASGRQSDYWQPLRLDREHSPAGLHYLSAIARARAHLSAGMVNGRIQAMRDQLHAVATKEHTPFAIPLAERIVGPVRSLLWLFFGAVLLVLCIACANVAGLLIARGAARQRELAVRAALGASAARVATQLLAESVLRTVIGGALGVGFAFGLLALMRHATIFHLPRIAETHIDANVIGFAVVLALMTGVICGAVPAWRAGRVGLASALRAGGRGANGSLGDDRFRRGLVIGELALSFALLVGAALVLESFRRLMQVDIGFETDHVITAVVNLPSSRYSKEEQQVQFYDRLLASVRAIPGVRVAGLSSALPIEGGTNGGIHIEGKTFPDNEEPGAEKRIVSPGYFEAIGARATAGRLFTSQDVAGGAPAVIVNETFVKRYLDTAAPVGRRVDFAWDTHGMQTIVGVLNDVREGALNDDAHPAIYIPLAQRPSSWMYLVVRTAADPATVLPSIRTAVLGIDPQLPLANIRQLREIVDDGAAPQRVTMSLLGTFAATAMLLAALGLYGVISYAVLQRTREFGVRTALGASPGEVALLVARQASWLVVIGLAIGIVIARLGTRFLASQLFGVRANAPGLYIVVAMILALIAGAAVIVPAFRAAAVDPLEALRAD